MRNIRLHTKFVAILILVAVVPLAFVSFATLGRFQQTLEKDAEKLGLQVSAAASAEIRAFVVSQMGTLDNVAAIYHPQFPVAKETASHILENILLSSDSFTEIAVVAPDGAEIVRKNKLYVVPLGDAHDDVEMHMAFEAIRDMGVYVGPVYIEAGKPFFNLGKRILDSDGKFAGAVIAQVDARIMPTVVAAASKARAGRVYIVDSEGYVIAYPDLSYVVARRNLSELPPVKDVLEKKIGASSYQYVNEVGEEVLGSAFPLTIEFLGQQNESVNVNWYVVAEQPVDTVFQDARNAGYFALIILFLVIGVAAGIAIFFANRIARPIVSLHDAAAKFAEGDLAYRAEVATGDEIGELAEGFNKMADTIRTTLDSLKAQEGIVSAERDKLKLILSGITNAVIAVDLDRRIVLFNHAAEELTGQKIDDVLGKPLEVLFELFDGEKRVSIEDYSPYNTATGPTYVKNDLRLVAKAGERFVNVVSGTIRGGKEASLGSILTFQDITKEYVVERNKREFLSIAAHQLRTPLTGMKWSVEYLLSSDKGRFDDKQKKVVSETQGSIERMITLVNDLLSVTRIDEGHLEIRQTVQKLDPVFSRAIAFFAEAAKKKGIIFDAHIDPDLPEVNVDAEKIEIVLNNLLDNAIHYTPTGGHVEFSARLERSGLIMSVKDSGIGISEKDRERIFTKFFRSGEALSRHTDGSGLGLYVAKNIVERHGGTIAFDSQEKGTTFTITLPIQ